jgi:hypothetical protein
VAQYQFACGEMTSVVMLTSIWWRLLWPAPRFSIPAEINLLRDCPQHGRHHLCQRLGRIFPYLALSTSDDEVLRIWQWRTGLPACPALALAMRG